MAKVFFYRSNPDLILEVDGGKAQEILREIYNRGVYPGYIVTRDRAEFLRLNPKLARHEFVLTVDEFVDNERVFQMSQDFILTYTGKKFTPLDPKPEQVDIEDIAHSLSYLQRFTGHSLIPFSVAQHSIHVMKLVRDKGYSTYWQLISLLHDASEAYANDLCTPIKKNLPEYKKIEEKIQETIYKAFDLPVPDKDEYKRIVKWADNCLVVNEMSKLMRHSHLYNYPVVEDFVDVDVFEQKDPMQVKTEFLYLYNTLIIKYIREKK